MIAFAAVVFASSIRSTSEGHVPEAMISCFISADWSKRPERRAVYMADLRDRRNRNRFGPSDDSLGRAIQARERTDTACRGQFCVPTSEVLGVEQPSSGG